jgi:hypothetical protein
MEELRGERRVLSGSGKGRKGRRGRSGGGKRTQRTEGTEGTPRGETPVLPFSSHRRGHRSRMFCGGNRRPGANRLSYLKNILR